MYFKWSNIWYFQPSSEHYTGTTQYSEVSSEPRSGLDASTANHSEIPSETPDFGTGTAQPSDAPSEPLGFIAELLTSQKSIVNYWVLNRNCSPLQSPK